MNVMSQKEYISLLSRHLFWDMDVNKVNLDTCPAQIIQRVLEYGNLKDNAFLSNVRNDWQIETILSNP